MNYSIALVPGDGIGPDVVAQAVEVLDAVADKYGHVFNYVELEAGGCAIDSTGEPLPAETLEAAKQCDAVLLGAVGGPKWETLPGHLRPERALLGLRAGLGVYANLRPAALLPQLRDACPIKDEVLRASNPNGEATFDLLIVRELTGGLYFGERGRSADGNSAFDTETYSKEEIERVLRSGYRAAAVRRKKLCVVDKANVLESSRLWREVAAVVSKDYPDIETTYMYVDNCAMQLVRAPGQFDVIVTSNLFGDILSDEASVLTGSIGMLASASLGDSSAASANAASSGKAAAKQVTMGLYEPIHGSAPDIAGQDIANPLATILSAAMLLRYSFGLEKEAQAIEKAVSDTLDAGYRTRDIASRKGAANEKIVGTKEMGKAVLTALEHQK
ncbi:3-isopropylmalate dehydrogenase [Gracilinema caldarium]|uniref:3-isopropylmalate dehydrogenase n=1 Tax=Gracilinema caldarium TaxID=215591 RepID=UPI0026ED9E15|nr:3-isopropylmalate dehydrogenase [Gracilinema caldarium]